MITRFQPLARQTVVKVADLMIRGLPRKYQPVTDLVDVQEATDLLMPEIRQIDSLGPDHNKFGAALLAAAVLSLRLRPECLSFWMYYIKDQWCHDSRGYDAVGILKTLVEDCKVLESISRSPGAQLLIFRAGLSLALRAANHAGYWATLRFDEVPIDHDTVDVLEDVRRSLGVAHSPTGFVDPALLRARPFPVSPPIIRYKMDLDAAMALAQADPDADWIGVWDAHRLPRWLGRLSIPAHLMNPAVLAAAIQTVAENPAHQPVWEAVFAGRWLRHKDGGVDVAGRIHLAVQAYHATKRTPDSGGVLYRRCQSALKAMAREAAFPDGWSNAPKGALDPALTRAWAGLNIDLEPDITWNGRMPRHPASPTKAHQKSHTRTFSTRHGTGKRAEEYFKKNYKTLLNDPAARLVDHRRNGRGYDFLILRRINRQSVREYYEVKGSLSPNAGCQLTNKQWKTACGKQNAYKLVVIDNMASNPPSVRIISNPARHLHPLRIIPRKPTPSWQVDSAQVQAEGHCIPNTPLET